MNNSIALYNTIKLIADKYRKHCEVLGIQPTREGFYIYMKGVS